MEFAAAFNEIECPQNESITDLNPEIKMFSGSISLLI